MFENATYFKFLVGVILVCLTANHMMALHRDGQLDKVNTSHSQAEVVKMLGTPESIIQCSAPNLAPIFGRDQLCKGTAQEIYVFAHCYLKPICPGGNYIVFDAQGHPLLRYGWNAPLLSR